ncbi:ATP synthase subunit delta [Actinomycetota bacterium]|nr:ATP synthase subunit delta [Actinomycetota bacterium]
MLAAQRRWEPVLGAAGAQAAELGEELFVLLDALTSSGSLRRTLTDPSLGAEAKEALVARLLADADPRVVQAAQWLVGARWSSEDDLAEAVEHLAYEALLAAAGAVGELQRVEEELFILTRALAGQRELRRALADLRVPAEVRGGIVDTLLDGEASPVTAALARRAAVAPRGRRFVAVLGHLGDLVAERRSLQVATVSAAGPLSAAQQERLADLLQQTYGQAIQLNVIVDPDVLGGLRVQIGPDVIDATVLARLADARRRLAS